MINIKEIYIERNKDIYRLFTEGMRQKEIGKLHHLSEGRVKKIIQEVRETYGTDK